MSNTFSAIVPILYSAMQTVPRELIGAIQAVDTRFDDKNAALNQTVRVPVAPTRSVTTYTPAMTTTAGTDAVENEVDVKFTNNYVTSFNLTGEQTLSLQSGSGGEVLRTWLEQMFGQAMRALANQIESDVCIDLKNGASRALGTAGTTPFASNVALIPSLKKILDDNGAPQGERSLILNTAAGANFRNISNLFKVNEAGSDDLLRNGNLDRLYGFAVRESNGVAAHTAGTGGTSYAVDNVAGYAVGSTAITLEDGSGTILAGDVFSDSQSGVDSNLYVVNTALAANVVTLNGPGLRKAWADEDTTAVGASYTGNIALWKGSYVLMVRPPAIPNSPVITQMPITDPVSGLTFLVCEIVGDGMLTYRVHAVTGGKVIQSMGIATLMG